MTTWTQPTEAERFALLRDAKTIAIVGASPNPERSSNEIARYLQARGSYELYYVNPMADEVLGGRPTTRSRTCPSCRTSSTCFAGRRSFRLSRTRQ